MNLEEEYKEAIVICFRGQDRESDMAKLGYELQEVQEGDETEVFVNVVKMTIVYYTKDSQKIIYKDETSGLKEELDLYMGIEEAVERRKNQRHYSCGNCTEHYTLSKPAKFKKCLVCGGKLCEVDE